MTIARLRLPIAQAMPTFAILYGLGAYWIVSSLALGLVAMTSLFVRLPVSALYLPAAALIGSAAAIAVALRSAGWIAAIGLAVLGLGYDFALACPLIAPATPTCDVGRLLAAHRGELAGALLGLPLALATRPRDGRSSVLLAAAIIASVAPVLRLVFVTVDPVTGSAAYERYLWIIRLGGAAALAAGVVLGGMTRGSVFGLLVIGAALLLPWLGGSFRQWWEDMQYLQQHGIRLDLATIVQTEWQIFLPLIYFALLLIGFAARRAGSAVVSAARRTPPLAQRHEGA